MIATRHHVDLQAEYEKFSRYVLEMTQVLHIVIRDPDKLSPENSTDKPDG